MLKKCLLFIFGLFFVVATAHANTVTIDLVDLYANGVKVAAMQMDFVTDGTHGFPFLYDENDFLKEPEISENSNFGAGSSIVQVSTFKSKWFIEYMEDYNPSTGIANASGLLIYTTGTDQYALRDGRLVQLDSPNIPVAIDPGSVLVFNFLDTANPDPLVRVESFSDGENNRITLSYVPIPSAFLLLGSGLFGLVALRRKRS